MIESREEANTALAAHAAAAADTPVDCRGCHPQGSGKVAEGHYAVSATALTDAQIAEWLSENMGVETPGGGNEGDEAEQLADFIGVSAN